MAKFWFVLIIATLQSLAYPDLHAQQYDVLGIGAPIMDIILPVNDDFLKTIPGEKGGSQQLSWEEFSKILANSNVYHPLVATGGSCSNTIKGLASLGQKSALAGKMGRDPIGQRFLDTIGQVGVIPLIVYSDTPTAQVACLITPDRQRTFRCFPGAGNEFTENDLSPEIFQGVKLVHIEGYALYNDSLAEKAMQLAKEAGALVSLDLGSFELVKRYKSKLLDLIPAYVDIIFANEDETRVLTGFGPEEGCDCLRQMCQAAVILIGKDGCWVGSPDEKCLCPAIEVTVIDTTGAGDLFASGFLHGYLQGCSLEECGHFGNLTGGTVVEFKGAEIPEHKWTELRRLLPKD